MKLAVFLVQSAGHTVLNATDADTGLALARARKPDLILMDIQLPGMDGLEATALFKADAGTCDIPVIALTTGHEGRRGAHTGCWMRWVHRQANGV